MKTHPGIETRKTEFLTVLSVSPMDEDHLSLQAIAGRLKWKLFKADRVTRALALLQSHDVSVVVCERDLTPGTWIDMLEHLEPMPNPPSLIVTSRLADERLWAEALNLGAWDVLMKPFDRSEVIRSVKLAWSHWRTRIEMAARSIKTMRAAG